MTFEFVQLRRFVLSACDGPFGSAIKSDHYVEEGARVVRLGNIGLAEWRNRDGAYLNREYWRTLERHHVRPNDLLIAGLGDEGNPVGRATVAPADIGDALVKADCYRLRLRGAEPRFLAYYLSSPHGLAQSWQLAEGSTRPRLTLGKAAALMVPSPSEDKQRAIAEYLDTATVRIDALINKKRRMIELLEKRWRYEAEHRMHGLSQSFGSIALKRVVRCLDGKRIPLSGEERSQRQGEYPYYGASGVIDGIDDYIFDETLVLLGEDGAQLADPDCEIALVVRGKVWVNNHAHVLRPVRADPDFLAFHLSTLDRGLFISGATREKITQADMNEIPVPDVPLESQQRVAAELLAVRVRCEATSTALRRQLGLLTEHRQALITAAVTGELEIPVAA